MNLVWTTQPPTEPGWYFCKHFDIEYVGFVKRREHQGPLRFCGVDEFGYRSLWLVEQMTHSKWAGPIPKPTEADHA